MSIQKFKVPKELRHSYFFNDGLISLNRKDLSQFNPDKLFIYDAAFFQGLHSVKPWEPGCEAIQVLLSKWLSIHEELQTYFNKRDLIGAKEPMRIGISIFLELLHWTNDIPVRLNPGIQYNELRIKPVNIQERLNFILARPVFYPAFMQLTELMIEMEKLYKKTAAMKKNV